MPGAGGASTGCAPSARTLTHNPRYLINFPTKQDWRSKSRLEDIRNGLAELVAEIRRRGIRSIAIPPLGCGNGGLDWRVVRPLIDAAMAELPDVDVQLYTPGRSPAAADQPIRTTRPNMTPGRAAVLQLMTRYATLDYRATQLEIQKLAYFAQEAGQPLQLHFTAHYYGPYADKLHKVLEHMEGHFTLGYLGDRNPRTEIEVLPAGREASLRFLSEDLASRQRIDRVARLIEGFETPYGLELLGTVHWIATHEADPRHDVAGVLDRLRAWSRRKGDLFTEHHVTVALDRLAVDGWLQPAAS